MTRRLVSIATFSFLMSACGGASTPAADSAADAADQPAESKGKRLRVSEEQIEKSTAQIDQRRVGDYFVHRYSGSYRETPVLLTEEVIAREGGLLVIDYTLEADEQKTELRVRLDPITGELDRVSRMEDGKELPGEFSDYDVMMASTVFSPDYNEGRVAKQYETCMVTGQEQPCITSRYHVLVGDRPGTLVVTTSEALNGRDVSGTLKSFDGDILYQSELVEMRRGKPEASVGPRNASLRFVPDEL